MPSLIGETLENIAHVLREPGRLSDMPYRVGLCRQALAMVPREVAPGPWAALHVELAMCLAANPFARTYAPRRYERAVRLRAAVSPIR